MNVQSFNDPQPKIHQPELGTILIIVISCRKFTIPKLSTLIRATVCNRICVTLNYVRYIAKYRPNLETVYV